MPSHTRLSNPSQPTPSPESGAQSAPEGRTTVARGFSPWNAVVSAAARRADDTSIEPDSRASAFAPRATAHQAALPGAEAPGYGRALSGRRPSRPHALLLNVIAGLAASMAMLGTLTTPAAAQDFAHNIIVPQSRVIVAPDTISPVKIQRVEATIDLREQVATTTLRVVLHNPAGRPQEAEVVMPVPDGAAIRYFQLEGLGDDGGARLLPKDEARAIYEAIVRRMVDPAILEFAGYGMIRSNVFPVPAGEESVIKLVYEQLLTADGQRIDYVLPRAQGASQSEWSITVNVESQREVAGVYSPTHDLTVSDAGATIPAGGGASTHRHTYTVNNAAQAGGAFQLAVLHQPDAAAAEGGLSATFLTYPDPRVTDGTTTGGYFLMLGGIPQPEADAPRLGKEITLVIDRSGSMRGEKMEQARAAAMQIVGAMGPHDLFNVIDYSDTVASFADQPVPATAQNIKRGVAYIAAIAPIGGTNIHDALVEALRQPESKGTLGMVLFMTDGLPTIGQTTEQAIRQAAKAGNQHDRRIFTFGVGYDVNTPLLRAVATDSRASSTFVQPGEDVEVKVGQVYRRLQGPVFTAPQIELATPAGGRGSFRIIDVLPTALPDVFGGEQLVVLGKYIGDAPMTMRISGNYLGRHRTFTAVLDPAKATTRNAFVPRLWATRRIGSLLESIREQPGSEGSAELVGEIVRLSTEYGILTEYTAFLAANPDDMPPMTPGEPMPVTQAPAAWRDGDAQMRLSMDSLEDRNRERAGRGSMNQEINLTNMAHAESAAAGANVYFTQSMARREITTVQQVNERAYFQQGRRWVDSAMLAQATEAPQQTVTFDTPAYSTLLDELIADNRQAVLANRGEIYLLHRGQRVLVINPS